MNSQSSWTYLVEQSGRVPSLPLGGWLDATAAALQDAGGRQRPLFIRILRPRSLWQFTRTRQSDSGGNSTTSSTSFFLSFSKPPVKLSQQTSLHVQLTNQAKAKASSATGKVGSCSSPLRNLASWTGVAPNDS
jgi:hypothetical protein